ncbi:hypothetical protein SAMN05444342_0961 [Haladaptatus paucihalophilus DX253]|uniref:Uncharacterized protein n=2 Tax=Haladaptatus paucihalophilus TaxID=367189 RepID=A0A1M6QLL5_HALPU|nr:hypothetical protein SAMN05444342_0961 [Haladaptatus paucihalophilus DX253]
MLYDEIDDPGEMTPTELHGRYAAELSETISSVGIDEVVELTGLDRETVESIADGETADDLSLEDAAAILATEEGTPEKDAILLEVRDHLLMGMTTGLLDVDTLARDIDGDFEARAVQQKIEGRAPMSVEEYALVHHAIAQRNDR